MSKPASMVHRVRTYLAYRRALGYTLRSQGYVLLRFARFADRSGHRGPVTTRIVLRWLEDTAASPTSAAVDLSAVRSFARYLAQRDGRSQAPDTRLTTARRRRRRPHIYTQEEVWQLLAATSRLKLCYDLGPLTYQTLFGLLASTGMRVSEALGLHREHVDLRHEVLRIERTKFHKTRLVPLHPTTASALRRYAVARDRRWGPKSVGYFFLGSRGDALSIECAQTRFRQVCEGLGWHRGNGEMPKPRLHDLRHTFACHRLQRWHRKGGDVHRHMNALATYLGHSRVTDTYWYLTATPELLAVAGRRFERFAAASDG